MSDVYKDSLEYHKKYKGKIGTAFTAPIENIDELSLAYTPGVAEVCREIGKDKNLAREYTLKSRTVAIVTDGSAILGLGNLGAEASIPVMEGKAALFKKFGGVDAFPICLKTQDTEEIISIVKNLEPVFGGINLEDISAPRCFEVERRLRDELSIPVMHDDQHGTAIVVLAGLINATKLRGIEKDSAKIVISGAGAAGIAITNLLLKYGFPDIVVLDSKGAIHKDRTDMNDEKIDLATRTNKNNEQGSLDDVIAGKNIFIGVSQPGVLTGEMVSKMEKDSIIFALANPVPEIMPDIALSSGAFIVGTGRSDFPNQLNNALVFPGLFAGALEFGVKKLDEDLFLKVAISLAGSIEPTKDRIVPGLFENLATPAIRKAFE